MSSMPNEGETEHVDADDGMVDLGSEVGSPGVENTVIQTHEDIARILLRQQGIDEPTPEQLKEAILKAFPVATEQA